MGLRSILGHIVKVGQEVAPPLVAAINPAAGAITQMVVNAVIRAEKHGGDGGSKKKLVMDGVLPAVVPLLNTVLQASGDKVNIDQRGVTSAVDQMVEAVVKLLNSVQVPAATAAAGSGATPPVGS